MVCLPKRILLRHTSTSIQKEKCTSLPLTFSKPWTCKLKLIGLSGWTVNLDIYQIFVFLRNGNGTIDFNEFLMGMALTSNRDPKSKIMLAFRIYDISESLHWPLLSVWTVLIGFIYLVSDKNGRIDKTEMIKLITAVYNLAGETDQEGENSVKERVNKIFREMDLDLGWHHIRR